MSDKLLETIGRKFAESVTDPSMQRADFYSKATNTASADVSAKPSI